MRPSPRAAFSAGCWGRGLWRSRSPRSWPCSASPCCWGWAVRCSTTFCGRCGCGCPGHRRAGHGILPVRGHGTVPVCPAALRRSAAGIRAAGRAGRRRALLLPVLDTAAARVVLLGGYPGFFGAFADFSPGLDEKLFKKNCDFRKKCLLFYVEMLYNKKNWTQIVQRGERGATWQDKSAVGCGQVS